MPPRAASATDTSGDAIAAWAAAPRRRGGRHARSCPTTSCRHRAAAPRLVPTPTAPISCSPPAAPGSPRATSRPKRRAPCSSAKRPASPRRSGWRSMPRFPRAALSRGIAGVRRHTLIVNLPGSPGGVRDGLGVLDDLWTTPWTSCAASGRGTTRESRAAVSSPSTTWSPRCGSTPRSRRPALRPAWSSSARRRARRRSARAARRDPPDRRAARTAGARQLARATRGSTSISTLALLDVDDPERRERVARLRLHRADHQAGRRSRSWPRCSGCSAAAGSSSAPA